MLKRSFLVFGVCVAAVVGLTAKTPLLLSKVSKQDCDAWVDSVYNSMTVDQRVGQLFALVFQSKDVDKAKREIADAVKRYHVGWVYFSNGPAENHAELANYANSVSSVPVLVALDGEWGLSMRMPDTPLFPKNMTLGAVQNDRLIYEYGLEMARECREVGVNVNFAPAVDVNSNPQNPVIGNRSFGEDALNVARKGVAYSRGLEDGGVLSVAKHFPGHGDTREDSHKTLPTVHRSLASIEAIDLAPFRSYVEAGMGGVMVAHLNVPALKTGKHPSSMSAKVVTDLLKRDMGFEGLVFTDALTMKGARTDGRANGLPAFLAGADVLLEPYKPEQSFQDVMAYYNKGEKERAVVEAACKKVLAYKYALGMHNYKPVEIEGLKSRINSRQSELVLRKLYAAAITVLKNDGDRIPVKQLDRKVCVVAIGGDEGDEKDFFSTCGLYTDVKTRRLSEHNVAGWADGQKDAGTVVAGVFDGSASTRHTVSKLIERMGADKVALVFFVKPYTLASFSKSIEKCPVVVEAYENQSYARQYAAQVVFGGSDATGRIPVTVKDVANVGDGVDVMASRLGYEMPEAVGFDARLVSQIDSIAMEGVRQKAFPGCQVLVARHGKVVVNKSYGYLDATEQEKVDNATLYDLASVSKATGTLSGVMKAIDDKKLSLTGALGDYIPELKENAKGALTIRDLLFHETGMPPSLNMYPLMTDSTSYSGVLVSGKRWSNYSRFSGGGYIIDGARVRGDITAPKATSGFDVRIGKNLFVGQATMDTVMSKIYNIRQRADRNYVYSCLNFCLLRQAEENVTGIRHDRYVYDNIFHRIGSYRTVYRPLDFFGKDEIAPTELDEYFRGGLVQGVVHDETAAFSGGIQGNAGLFSNANDLAKLCQMWLNKGMYGGERILSSETVTMFLTMTTPNSFRGLGFDKPNVADPDNSSTCAEAGAEVVGHTGFTGTAFWVDPKEDMIYVFLCNRVYPSRYNPAFVKVGARANIFRFVYESLARNSR